MQEYARQAHDEIPFVRMMRVPAAEIRERAAALLEKIKPAAKLRAEIIAGESLVGGGSAPTSTLPTFLLAVTAQSLSADELSARLRMSNPPIVARVEEGRVLLDLRTVFEAEDPELGRALKEIGS